MIVVSHLETTHTTPLIMRFSPVGLLSMNIYNETTREEDNIEPSYIFNDGIVSITYNYTFTEDEKYQVKITNNGSVIYRGKLIAINQETQDYTPTDGLYIYSTI